MSSFFGPRRPKPPAEGSIASLVTTLDTLPDAIPRPMPDLDSDSDSDEEVEVQQPGFHRGADYDDMADWDPAETDIALVSAASDDGTDTAT